MRKLLVKLVAIETALLGWLSYWLFLVYANNPIVGQGLANQLGRFPQISFTTIDISILAVITVFSVLIAFRFDRGLRPGMRLERALKMLENLMKRNLFLEAQLVEVRTEKPTAINPSQSTSQGILVNPPPTNDQSLRKGSWERAFRTPIEAGPPIPIDNKKPFLDQPQPRPVRFAERKDEKAPAPTSQAVNPPTWEDSPRRLMETKAVITPSQPPPRKLLTPLGPSVGSQNRPPYIPAPAPKLPPLTNIATPVSHPTPQTTPAPYIPAKQGIPAQARPINRIPLFPTSQPVRTGVTSLSTQTVPQAALAKPPTPAANPPAPLAKLPILPSPQASTKDYADDDDEDEDEDEAEDSDDISSTENKDGKDKQSSTTKKEKPSFDEEEFD